MTPFWFASRKCTDISSLRHVGPLFLSSVSLTSSYPSRPHTHPWLSCAGMISQGFPPSIAQLLTSGVDLGLATLPAPTHLPNYRSLLSCRDLVSVEFARLVSMGRLDGPLPHRPRVVCPMGAVTKTAEDGSIKTRIIFDASAGGLNPCLHVPSFRLPTIDNVVATLRPYDYMVSFDLNDGFFHVPVSAGECDLLGCQHPVTGEFYRYMYLPFGVATCPVLFSVLTILSAEIVRSWPDTGPLHVYVDDFFASAPSLAAASSFSAAFLAFASVCGLRVSVSKSRPPAQVGRFIGFEIDTRHHTLTVPLPKLTKIRSALSAVAASPRPSLRALTSLAGRLIHLCKVVRGGKSNVRALYRATDRAAHDRLLPWSAVSERPVVVTPALRAELSWWQSTLLTMPRRRLWITSSGHYVLWDAGIFSFDAVDDTCCVLFSDARKDSSGMSWGATNGVTSASGAFGPDQASWSINALELKAILLGLAHFKPFNQRVLVYTDNTTASMCVNKRHPSRHAPTLHTLVRELVAWEASSQCEVVAAYVPGAINDAADELSRDGQSSVTVDISPDFRPLLPPDTHVVLASARAGVRPPLLVPRPLTALPPWKHLVSQESPVFPRECVIARYTSGKTAHPASDWFLVP